MTTSYFTFGQTHAHVVAGKVYDKDSVVMITAENPRDVIFTIFGDKWAMQYDQFPDISLFPRGIVNLPY